jgi:glutathione S-transferase
MALKLADIKCELREIRLNNKPDHMLKVSPKGTVPVLILEDRIIDESMEIVNWVISLENIFDKAISKEKIEITESLILDFDNDFKHHLDRYKYSTRYKEVDLEKHRSVCMQMLIKIEDIASKGNWFFGKNISKLDISIFPFIRQFRIADIHWFDNQTSIPKVQKLLNNFLNSTLFEDIMINYELWEEGAKGQYFP